MLQGGYKCLLRSKFWEVLSLFIFIHERHKYQLKKQKKKLCRTSCWNVPGHLIRTSPDVLCERPESKCYGESLALRPIIVEVTRRNSQLEGGVLAPVDSIGGAFSTRRGSRTKEERESGGKRLDP